MNGEYCWITPQSNNFLSYLWQTGSRKKARPLPSTAVTLPVAPNYTAWWQRHMCETTCSGLVRICRIMERLGLRDLAMVVSPTRYDHHTTKPHRSTSEVWKWSLQKRFRIKVASKNKRKCGSHYIILRIKIESQWNVLWKRDGIWSRWLLSRIGFWSN